MYDWTPTLGENSSDRPEPENKIDKYTVAATKDARVTDHLKKERLVDKLKMSLLPTS